MLCTSCNHEVAPVVAVDIDGTISDYHGNLIRFADDYFGAPRRIPSAYKYDGSMSLSEFMGLSKHEYRTMKLAYRQGGQKRLQPLQPGARGLLRALRSAGAEVWLTTTRPYNRFDSTDPDTLNWLQRHELQWDHLLYDDDKYLRLTQLVGKDRVVGIVDDLDRQYDLAEDLELPVYLIKTPYNRAIHREREAASLAVIKEVFLENISAWKGQNK